MTNDPERLDVTVAVLTYNGEDYLEAILSALERQEFDGSYEVLVIDSGSSDSTLDIVAHHPTVRLHQIPNSEFGHGKTRNLAARLARGRVIAYLTHDAIPKTVHWLREISAPLLAPDTGIKAVMGKQVPRPACFPLLKYEIEMVFRNFGPDFGTTVFYDYGVDGDQGMIDALGFYSDVNSATLVDFLLDVIPYRDVRYSEDMIFGHDLIEAGYRKAYAPRAAVIHSNDLTLAEYRRRIFDETVGLRQIGKVIEPPTVLGTVRLTVRGILADSVRLVRDRRSPHEGGYTLARRVYWLFVNPGYHIAKWRSFRRSALVDLNDEAAIRAGSLEHSRKA
jgi:rhamnosyltransferase